MDDKGLVADESIAAGISGQIEICVLGKESESRSKAMLATEITNLASSGIGWVARRYFAAVVGIQVLSSGIAITICGHRTNVNVVGLLNALVWRINLDCKFRKVILRNGPRLAGSPAKLARNITPTPPGAPLAVRSPRMAIDGLSKKVAV